jgi:hypothetical protein
MLKQDKNDTMKLLSHIGLVHNVKRQVLVIEEFMLQSSITNFCNFLYSTFIAPQKLLCLLRAKDSLNGNITRYRCRKFGPRLAETTNTLCEYSSLRSYLHKGLDRTQII